MKSYPTRAITLRNWHMLKWLLQFLNESRRRVHRWDPCIETAWMCEIFHSFNYWSRMNEIHGSYIKFKELYMHKNVLAFSVKDNFIMWSSSEREIYPHTKNLPILMSWIMNKDEESCKSPKNRQKCSQLHPNQLTTIMNRQIQWMSPIQWGHGDSHFQDEQIFSSKLDHLKFIVWFSVWEKLNIQLRSFCWKMSNFATRKSLRRI